MKRIVEVTQTEFGFAETHATLEPVERQYRRPDDAYPEFMDTNVKQLLDSAKRRGGYVLLINETPTTYSTQRVYACPDCGFPLKTIGRGATLKKHGPRYTCPRAEACSKYGIKDDKHQYVRAWSRDELEQHEEAVAS